MLGFDVRTARSRRSSATLARDVARAAGGQRRSHRALAAPPAPRRLLAPRLGGRGLRATSSARSSRSAAGPTRTSTPSPRLLANLDVPRKGLVGPWGHMWPEIGAARPADRLPAGVRPLVGPAAQGPRHRGSWTSRCSGPGCRSPSRRHPITTSGPGRWVAEAAWPRPRRAALAFVLDAEGLAPEPTGDAALVHTSPQTVGLDAGAWCAYGNPADIPVDQRRDDARSLTSTPRRSRSASRCSGSRS